MAKDMTEQRRNMRDKACAVTLVNRMKWQKAVITYQELADIMSGICEIKILADRLDKDLARLLRYCEKCGLPALSVMVVNKATGVPGDDFFGYYRDLHGVGADVTDIEILRKEHKKCLECNDWSELYKHLKISVPAPKM